jgi:uncharacterized protein (TIGR03067 family)
MEDLPGDARGRSACKFRFASRQRICAGTFVRQSDLPVLRSTPADKKPESTAEPATEFEGEWVMVSHVSSGRPMNDSMRQWVRRITVGNVSTVSAAGEVILQVEFTTDGSTYPKCIDYFNLAGSNEGKAQLGIYEHDGRLLRICVAAPGAERSTEFESKKGDKNTYTTWKKV